MVTHTLSVAEAIATNIGVLRGGELISTGSLTQLRGEAKRGNDASLEDVYAALTHRS